MIGVVVMAYGSPASLDDVEAYYTHIRRGRPPSNEELADLVARYAAIGGVSPLRERTEAQRAAIQRALDDIEPGRFATALGLKHAEPFIEDTAARLIGDGARRLIGLVLTPHYSKASVGEYISRLGSTAANHGVTASGMLAWHDLGAWVDFQTAAVREGLDGMAADRTQVLFTAHSLPERALVDDPYTAYLSASAEAIAQRVGLDSGRWQLAWQSAGRTADAWRGPDILDVLGELAASGTDSVLVCPQGFTSDHLEVLYDLDVRAAQRAHELGLAFRRTRSVNDDPKVMGALAANVAALAGR